MPFTLRILILISLISIPLLFAGLGQDAVAAEGAADAQAAEAQLVIYRDSLFNGSTEKIRIQTALVMLDSGDEPARQVLLEALNQKENAGARVAVCRALSQSRLENKTLKNKDVFIEPLLNILRDADSAQAKLVSEATRIFDYEVIGPRLEGLARDASAPLSARLNAINVLKFQPDRSAATTILALVDDENKQLGSAAREAFAYSVGTPVGKDAQARSAYSEQLQKKSKHEFLRDWLINQENRLRQERAQKTLWSGLYFKAIDQLYANIGDKDAQQRAEFLIVRLQAPQAERTLWALQKVYELRLKGEKIPEGLTPVLVGLVASSNRSVRLEAARQLSYMGQLESAPDLLTQLDKEKDDEVRTELFTALGAACNSALLNGGVPAEIKTQILNWAARFLEEQDATRAVKGADVIGKLLEKNGLAAADMGKYLDLLKGRYRLSKTNVLTGELLRIMASLCADRSGCKNEARERFQPIFQTAIGDQTDRVREEAIQGLINVDKVLAINSLRASIAKEENQRIRARIIELASVAGVAQDLEWLLPSVGSDTETEAAWQAVIKILASSEPALLGQWMQRLKGIRQQERVGDGLWQDFLKDAERKAEKKPALLKEVLRLWVDFYRGKGDMKQARAYLARLYQLAQEGDKAALDVELFSVDLRLGDVKTAVATLQKLLGQGDLDEKNGYVQAITQLLANDSAEKTHRQTVEAILKAVKLEQARPNWEKLKGQWMPPEARPESGGTPK